MRKAVAALGFLVAPVRGDAVLGGAVHVPRADLHFQRLALRPDDGGVQRLVDAVSGLGDVVLEPSRHRLPQRMHHADSGIAVPDLVAEDPDADQVVDVVEVAALDDHLLVDRPVVLGPTFHRRLDLGSVEGIGDLSADLGEVGVPGRRAAGDQADDLVVLLRVQDREGQVFELPLDAGHTQPMRKGRNDFQRLAGFARLLLRRQEAHGAHVVQPVGDLDHQHPGVTGHRGDHLADGLALGGGAQHHPIQLGHAVDEVTHLLAELLAQSLQRVAGVLDGVVQQRGHQSGGVHAQFGEDVRDGQGVGDVRITGMAQLRGVPLVGDLEGALQQRQVGLRIDLPVHRHERFQHRVERGALGGHPPGQAGPNAARRAARGFQRLGRRIRRLGLRRDRLPHQQGVADVGGRVKRLRRALVVRHVGHLRPRGYRAAARARAESSCAAATPLRPDDPPARSIRGSPPPP